MALGLSATFWTLDWSIMFPTLNFLMKKLIIAFDSLKPTWACKCSPRFFDQNPVWTTEFRMRGQRHKREKANYGIKASKCIAISKGRLRKPNPNTDIEGLLWPEVLLLVMTRGPSRTLLIRTNPNQPRMSGPPMCKLMSPSVFLAFETPQSATRTSTRNQLMSLSQLRHSLHSLFPTKSKVGKKTFFGVEIMNA